MAISFLTKRTSFTPDGKPTQRRANVSFAPPIQGFKGGENRVNPCEFKMIRLFAKGIDINPLHSQNQASSR